MFDQARSLESAMKISESYTVSNPPVNAAVPASSPPVADEQETSILAATAESEGAVVISVGLISTLARNVQLAMRHA